MGVLLCVLLTATPGPAASKASELAHAQTWDELYLAFATAAPEAYSKEDQGTIGRALAQGCLKLLPDDPVMAYSLGDRAAAFAPSPDALFCTGLSGRLADQRAAAEAALRTGARRYPTDYRFRLELGRLLAEEGDAAGAREALGGIPRKAPAYEEAQGLLRQQEKPATGPSVPVSQGARPPGAGHEPGGRAPPPSAGSLSYESSVDEEGRRMRSNQYFRFRYFNAQRDFGQRADYEGRVQGALDEARRAADRLLGVARQSPTDVILYSRREFELHHGRQAAMAIAGFYSGSAIRMNDSAEIDAHNQAVLVHEYVHAVVDELSGFHDARIPVWLNEGLAEYTEWRYQGREGPAGRLDVALKQQALRQAIPSLSTLSAGPLIGLSNPAMAYALAASAVKVLVAKRGMREVLGLIEDVGKGAAFPQAYRDRYGQALSELDAEVIAELAH